MFNINYNRRDFISIGSLFCSMGLTDISLSEEQNNNISKEDASVVWVWLGGGPTQFETFHANKNQVDSKYESVNGKIITKEGHCLGGLWENLSKQSDKIVTVNSFGHKDASHLHASHYVMDGVYNSERSDAASQKDPSHGAIISAVYGPNGKHGIPHYVNQGKIDGDKGAWLGSAFNPFDPSNKENLIAKVELDRFANRFDLLNKLDLRNNSKNTESWNDMQKQAYDTVLGQVHKAFDINLEPQNIKDQYGSGIGDQLLLARRLVESGSKFITIHYGGWDMHSDIEKALKERISPLDKALAAFIQDIWSRGLQKNVMLVVTGEFGRTTLNQTSGRDHWPMITPLLISGGNYQMGRSIGTSDKSYVPQDNPFIPADLKATVFNHFGIDPHIQRIDMGGRPRYLLEGENNNPPKIIL